METKKTNYETPVSKSLEVKMEGTILDVTNLEPIEEGDEHDW